MAFYLERFNGNSWTAVRMSNMPVSPYDIQGPKEGFPSAETPNNACAFTGLPGWKARIRHDDQVFEEFEWAKVPVNYGDQNSDMKWGWKSVYRNYQPVTNSDPMPLNW